MNYLTRVCVAMLLAVSAGSSALALEIGTSAPEFALPGSKQEVKLSDYRGKVVYLDFWASWCAPCKRSFPWMNALQKRYGEKGLQIIAISLDAKVADAKQFLLESPVDFVIAFDSSGSSGKQFAIKGMPSSFLLDANGKILHRHAGFNDEKAVQIEQQIKAALGVN